jgi:hypothetical protein
MSFVKMDSFDTSSPGTYLTVPTYWSTLQPPITSTITIDATHMLPLTPTMMNLKRINRITIVDQVWNVMHHLIHVLNEVMDDEMDHSQYAHVHDIGQQLLEFARSLRYQYTTKQQTSGHTIHNINEHSNGIADNAIDHYDIEQCWQPLLSCLEHNNDASSIPSLWSIMLRHFMDAVATVMPSKSPMESYHNAVGASQPSSPTTNSQSELSTSLSCREMIAMINYDTGSNDGNAELDRLRTFTQIVCGAFDRLQQQSHQQLNQWKHDQEQFVAAHRTRQIWHMQSQVTRNKATTGSAATTAAAANANANANAANTNVKKANHEEL